MLRSRKNLSLVLRISIIAALWSVIALTITAFFMTSYQARIAEEEFDKRLAILAELIAASFINQQIDSLNLGNPLFQQPGSGWFWQISTDKNEVLAVSNSLFDPLPKITNFPFNSAGQRVQTLNHTSPSKIRLLEKNIIFNEEHFTIKISGNAKQIEETKKDFQKFILYLFSLVALMIVLASILQVKYGLSPLKKMQKALQEMRLGKAQKIEGHYPQELMSLADEINHLMDANKKIIERSRHHVGNLAHALKTPLSILRNNLYEHTKPNENHQQIDNIQNWIDRYLSRARKAESASRQYRTTHVKPIIEDIVRVIEKITFDKEIAIEMKIDETLYFRGESFDLQDIVGNLIENAFKFTTSKIKITAQKSTSIKEKDFFEISIEDDGKGINEEDMTNVLNRGTRLDEKVQGTGLGLSIVCDTLELYHGKIYLKKSLLGGLMVNILLPAVPLK